MLCEASQADSAMLHKSIVKGRDVSSTLMPVRSQEAQLHRLVLLLPLPSPSFPENKIKSGIEVNFLELTHISEQLRVTFSSSGTLDGAVWQQGVQP